MAHGLLVLLVFSVVSAFILVAIPGWALRQIVRLYPKGDLRREELIAELYEFPFKERWFFVAQCLELSVSEGLPSRWRSGHVVRPSAAPTVLRKNEPASYRGPEVCAMVGITYRQLDYWARTDMLRPSIEEARGESGVRRYSYSDLVKLKVIKRLLEVGSSLRSVREAIGCLSSIGLDLATANLVVDDRGAILACSGDEIIDLLQGGQGVLNIMPLASLVHELDTAITDFGVSDEGVA